METKSVMMLCNQRTAEELIAQDPLEDRSSSRLLVLDKNTGEVEHHIFRDILDYLNEDAWNKIQMSIIGLRENQNNIMNMNALSRRRQRLQTGR